MLELGSAFFWISNHGSCESDSAGWIWMVGLLAILHVFLGTFVSLGLPQWDLALSRWIQSGQSPFWDSCSRLLSQLGNGANPFLLVALIGVVLFLRGWTRELQLLLAGAASSALLNHLLKLWFDRSRPDVAEIRVLTTSGSSSYPSGHAAFALLLFGFFYLISLRRGGQAWTALGFHTLCVMMAVGVGLSRIYLGSHWASDVLGGYLGACIVRVMIRHYYRAGPK